MVNNNPEFNAKVRRNTHGEFMTKNKAETPLSTSPATTPRRQDFTYSDWMTENGFDDDDVARINIAEFDNITPNTDGCGHCRKSKDNGIPVTNLRGEKCGVCDDCYQHLLQPTLREGLTQNPATEFDYYSGRIKTGYDDEADDGAGTTPPGGYEPGTGMNPPDGDDFDTWFEETGKKAIRSALNRYDSIPRTEKNIRTLRSAVNECVGDGEGWTDTDLSLYKFIPSRKFERDNAARLDEDYMREAVEYGGWTPDADYARFNEDGDIEGWNSKDADDFIWKHRRNILKDLRLDGDSRISLDTLNRIRAM